jgi:hypothetical protein
MAFQCEEEYAGTDLDGLVTTMGGIQEWEVPVDGNYTITAIGAQGASGSTGHVGGKGTEMTGTFELSAGAVLFIAVGQQGLGQDSVQSGGGGGGSWVVMVDDGAPIDFDDGPPPGEPGDEEPPPPPPIMEDEPLVIAGGGGGTRTSVSQNGCDATTSMYGTTASGSGMTHTCAERPTGSVRTGGEASSTSWGSGGGGFDTDGGADSSYGFGGSSWENGLVGGGHGSTTSTFCDVEADGGFGAGGSGNGCNGGGGGGGYTGGAGGRVAGGGGSFNAGIEPFSLAGVGEGDGVVYIEGRGSEMISELIGLPAP